MSRSLLTSQTPERSRQQRLEALRRANEVRSRRAELKEQLRTGEVLLGDVLGDPPEYVHTAKVADLLVAIHKMGPVRANRILEKCRVSPSKTVIGLTPRQRRELVEQLEG